MASGFGALTTTGRCTGAWRAFATCMAECEEREECKIKKDDYLECLNNKNAVWEIKSNK